MTSVGINPEGLNKTTKIKPRHKARHTEARSNFMRVVHMMADSFPDKHEQRMTVSFIKDRVKGGGYSGSSSVDEFVLGHVFCKLHSYARGLEKV